MAHNLRIYVCCIEQQHPNLRCMYIAWICDNPSKKNIYIYIMLVCDTRSEDICISCYSTIPDQKMYVYCGTPWYSIWNYMYRDRTSPSIYRYIMTKWVTPSSDVSWQNQSPNPMFLSSRPMDICSHAGQSKANLGQHCLSLGKGP